MSFIITMYVREGIVMASDSRLTLNTEQHPTEKTVVQVAVGQSDSNYKTFWLPIILAFPHMALLILMVSLLGDISNPLSANSC